MGEEEKKEEEFLVEKNERLKRESRGGGERERGEIKREKKVGKEVESVYGRKSAASAHLCTPPSFFQRGRISLSLFRKRVFPFSSFFYYTGRDQ